MSTGNEKAPRQRRKFTAQYRHEAARMVIDSGRTIAEVATELGLGATVGQMGEDREGDHDTYAIGCE